MCDKQEKEQEDSVWIEIKMLDTAEERDVLLLKFNKFIKRIGIYGKFWYADKECKYCFTYAPSGCFKVLSDNGEWFNLNYLQDPDDERYGL